MYSMRAEIDVQIPMRDGISLVGDVFRPAGDIDPVPVLITVGPYGKDVPFHAFNPAFYAMCPHQSPTMVWETPDPAWWVPRGYAIVRVDQRGMRKSPGKIELHLQQERNDFHDAIEWAAAQPWCNGKVGMTGVSYFAFTQWQVAATRPPSLAAIIPWEGFSNFYREEQRQGGIFCNGFVEDRWYRLRILHGQHGRGTVGEPVLDPETLASNRVYELPDFVREHEFDNDTYRQMSADLSMIDVPVYSSGNWGGMSLHGRGCIEGFLKAGSKYKWLEMHQGNFVLSYYGEEGLQTQLRFFDYWLKGIDNGLLHGPRIKLAIRNGPGRSFYWRWENEWPLARTRWTKLFLDTSSDTLGPEVMASAEKSYTGQAGKLTFMSAPFDTDSEVTGPLVARLWVSSSTNDMDIFLDLRQFDADGKEVLVEAAYAPAGPIAKGWLRVSHRKTDPARSTFYQPYHTHDESWKLSPGEIVPVDVEIWPTSMVYPAGSRLALSVSSVDGVTPGQYYHTDPTDRPPAVFVDGRYTVHTGGQHDSHLLVPFVPIKQTPA